MAYKVNGYACGYCKKLFLNKKSVLEHEKHCPKNPFAMYCPDCENFYLDVGARCKKGHRMSYRQFDKCPDKILSETHRKKEFERYKKKQKEWTKSL